ncbi:MAG: hypothetical protein RIS21_1231 [Planctomycetota bacterium]|jgi:agmatinase
MTFDPNKAALNDGIYGLPHGADDARVHLIPVPFEATTSYGGGTADGPAAILAASRQVDLHDVDVGDPWKAGIFMVPADRRIVALNKAAKKEAAKIIARGGEIGNSAALLKALTKVNDASEEVNGLVYGAAWEALDAGKIVGVVGGDHAVPYGNILAHAERHPGLGILHLDAHADLRVAYEGFTWSHASIMHNVMQRIPQVGRLVQVGIRDVCAQEMDDVAASKGRIVTHTDASVSDLRMRGASFASIAARIVADLPKKVYVSFDIDGLDPVNCPHTGTPVPGGLQFREAVFLIGEVVRSGRTIVGFDLNEVAPGPEGDEWDANVAARMLYKMIGFTLKSRGG